MTETPRERLLRDMEDRLLSEVGRRRRHSRRRWTVVGVGSLVVGAAAVSAWVWLIAPAFAERGAHCYLVPDLNSSYVEAGSPDEANDIALEVSDPSETAIEICASLWAAGVMGEPRPEQPLFVCRDTDGALQVFPVVDGLPGSCAALGTLQPPK